MNTGLGLYHKALSPQPPPCVNASDPFTYT